MPAELIEAYTYRLDEIVYNIIIVHAEGGYWGKCYCPECRESDEGTAECGTPAEAGRLAERNADAHHSVAHSGSKISGP